jgi:hypothetical protein
VTRPPLVFPASVIHENSKNVLFRLKKSFFCFFCLSKVLGVEQKLFFEYFLFRVRPNVDELPLVELAEGVGDESVGVDKSPATYFRRK